MSSFHPETIELASALFSAMRSNGYFSVKTDDIVRQTVVQSAGLQNEDVLSRWWTVEVRSSASSGMCALLIALKHIDNPSALPTQAICSAHCDITSWVRDYKPSDLQRVMSLMAEHLPCHRIVGGRYPSYPALMFHGRSVAIRVEGQGAYGTYGSDPTSGRLTVGGEAIFFPMSQERDVPSLRVQAERLEAHLRAFCEALESTDLAA